MGKAKMVLIVDCNLSLVNGFCRELLLSNYVVVEADLFVKAYAILKRRMFDVVIVNSTLFNQAHFIDRNSKFIEYLGVAKLVFLSQKKKSIILEHEFTEIIQPITSQKLVQLIKEIMYPPVNVIKKEPVDFSLQLKDFVSMELKAEVVLKNGEIKVKIVDFDEDYIVLDGDLNRLDEKSFLKVSLIFYLNESDKHTINVDVGLSNKGGESLNNQIRIDLTSIDSDVIKVIKFKYKERQKEIGNFMKKARGIN